jgi:2-dehydro-3-deoxyphosphogluconate aldolase/(4S)-4-hydroxy-2-oxoglutarate aldolase
LPFAEIIFRTAAAEEVIRILAERVPELIVGAGTVLTTEQAGKPFGGPQRLVGGPEQSG